VRKNGSWLGRYGMFFSAKAAKGIHAKGAKKYNATLTPKLQRKEQSELN
jgi:hypothetical protein